MECNFFASRRNCIHEIVEGDCLGFKALTNQGTRALPKLSRRFNGEAGPP